MVDILRNQTSCKQCWYPCLKSHGNQLLCPACDSRYTLGLNLISGPRIDKYDSHALFTISSILNRNKGYSGNLNLLLEDLSIESGATVEQWILAAHHIKCLYSYYSSLPKQETQYIGYPPSSKRSFPGSFDDYRFNYWRKSDSPFNNLSDDGFRIIFSHELKPTLPWPFHRLYHRKNWISCFSIPRTPSYIYKDLNWDYGIMELIDAELIQRAPYEDNLELISSTRIRKKLKDFNLRGGRTKQDVISTAINELPDIEIEKLIQPNEAYVPTSKTIDEFRFRLYGIPNLSDDVRFHNTLARSKISTEEFLKMHKEDVGAIELVEVYLTLHNNARDAPNYKSYLKNEMPPVEAMLAVYYATINDFRSAYEEIQKAYALDIQYNDISKTININHFASLIRFQLQLELILSQYQEDFYELAPASERKFKMWIALYDRISDDSSTPFLLDHYEEIFDIYKNCSRESENKFRDLSGVPRIGEGWVSEVELLKLVIQIFPNERVIHQASPDWLGLQRLDIYIPKQKLAIEYQGRQHFEPVEYFGGEDGLKRNKERDKQKAELCAENNITLIYFRYDESIDYSFVDARIRKILEERKLL